MSYDEKLAQRVRDIFAQSPDADEKAMFGGLAFMLNGKMCCGVLKDDLVVRVGPDQYDAALRRPHARPMDFTGRPMKGYVYVAPAGCRDRRSLESWVRMAVQFVEPLPRSAAPRKRNPRSGRGASSATPAALNSHKSGARR